MRLAGGALLVACLLAAFLPLAFARWIPMIIAAQLVVAALLARAVWRRSRASGEVSATLLFAVGIAARIALAFTPHDLSDDAYRYHWDGKVLANGVNPYRYSPDDPEVRVFTGDPFDEKINHPDLVTVYPPLAELLFVPVHMLRPGTFLGLHALSLCAEVLAWFLFWRELGRRGEPRQNLALLAWMPIAVFQSYAPGHTEALGLPFMAWLLVEVHRAAALRAGIALALACLVKPAPLVLVPAILRALPRRAWPRFFAGAGAVTLILALPFAGAGENLFRSMRLMAQTWDFNGSLSYLARALLPGGAVRPALAVLLVCLVAVATWRGRDFASRSLAAMGSLYACSTIVYPWYVLWLLPLLVWKPNPAAFVFAALLPIADVVMIDFVTRGSWHPEPWTRWVIYGPTALVLLGQALWPRIRGASRRA